MRSLHSAKLGSRRFKLHRHIAQREYLDTLLEVTHITIVQYPNRNTMVRGSELDVAVRASIVSMRFGAGMEAKAIAAKLNLDAGTVRGTCHRIKKAANSEDLLELLKHCRTKSRSGRPSMKNAAAVAAAASSVSAAAEDNDDKTSQASQHPDTEPNALAGAASTSPDRLAETETTEPAFETPAWPDEPDLTAANNTTHIQPHPPFVPYQIAPAPENITVTALDPRLSVNLPPDPFSPQQ